MIKEIAEPIFATTLPSPLNTLQFKKIDLGTVPLHFSKVDVHRTENEGIKLDLDIDWDGKSDIELDGSMLPKMVCSWLDHSGLHSRQLTWISSFCRELSISSSRADFPSSSAP
jgi:hypothetical protein